MKKIIDNKNLGHVKIFKSDFKNTEDYESYKTMFNAHVEREGTNDEYIVFHTINLSKALNYKKPSKPKPKKIKTAHKITQLNQWGEFCCDFGIFESKEEAVKQMFKGLSKLYKGFKKEVWLDENSGKYHCEKYDFIIDIVEIEFNKFGEM
jgi:hypothetical protein